VYAVALSMEGANRANWYGAHEECLLRVAHPDANLPPLGAKRSDFYERNEDVRQ
jgi:hypothetical protein